MSDSKATLKLEPIEPGEHDRRQLEELADQDMEDFNQFMTGQLGQSPLTSYEKTILKTFMMFKLGVKMTK